ncbi:hypothetical protein O5D80_004742 [Batrachochytrium dendrobatidis]|nr:hypothetical protein O5D80_004742 [Batrachochytrium dendrobatidis]
MAKMLLPIEPFYDVLFTILTSTSLDPAEKCEALLDAVEVSGALGQQDAELLVRALLDTLESRGPDSLLCDSTDNEYTDNLCYYTSFKSLDSTIGSNSSGLGHDRQDITTNDGIRRVPYKQRQYPFAPHSALSSLSLTSPTATTTSYPSFMVSSNSTSRLSSKELNLAAQEFTPSYPTGCLSQTDSYSRSDLLDSTGSTHHVLQSNTPDIIRDIDPLFARIDMQDCTETPQSYSYDSPEFSDSLDLKQDVDEAENAYWDLEESQQYSTLEAHDVLQSIFINIPIDHIKAVLEANMYNIESSMDCLLNDSGTIGAVHSASEPRTFESNPSMCTAYDASVSEAPSTPVIHLATSKSREPKQICRHFMIGQCYRSDCWYSHDPDALVCKFWLQGRCFKGNNCEFVHGEGLTGFVASSSLGSGAESAFSSSQTSGNVTINSARKTKFGGASYFGSPTLNDTGSSITSAPIDLHLSAEEEFPSLGSVTKNSCHVIPSTPAQGSSSKPTAVSKINFWNPTAKYNDVTKKAANGSSGQESIIDKAFNGRKTILIGGSGASLKPAIFSNSPQIVSTEKEIPSSLSAHAGTGGRVYVNSKWLSTGDTLAASYAEYRQEAIDVAIHRNQLFQRATDAFLSGNKAAARALSLSAKKLNDQVEQLHNIAAQKIFLSRNAHNSPSQSSSTTSTKGLTGTPKSQPFKKQQASIVNPIEHHSSHIVDLHGLHPSEACTMLQLSIDNLVESKFVGDLIIVTGTGHHSRTQKAKVLPHVRSYLQQGGWRPKDGTLHDRRGGILVIQIK